MKVHVFTQILLWWRYQIQLKHATTSGKVALHGLHIDRVAHQAGASAYSGFYSVKRLETLLFSSMGW